MKGDAALAFFPSAFILHPSAFDSPMTVYEVLAMGWLPTLPEGFETALGRYALLAAFAGSAVGAVLWLAGSRFSRSLVTLLAVSVGAVVGMHLPGWMGWSVDAMGVAFCGALA